MALATHRSVVHMLQDAADKAPRAEALVYGERRFTYGDYRASVAGFAGELAPLAGPGERIATLLSNSAEACIAAFAILAARMQHVPLNPLYTPRELDQILADAKPAVLVVSEALAGPAAPLAQKHAARTIVVGPQSRLLDQWKGSDIPLPGALPTPEALALLQYTGGTTGRSKGVNLTHAAIATNVSQREALLPSAVDAERILCVMPLFHAYAMAMGLFLSVYCRGCLVVLPRYRPEELLAAVERERITIFPGSPTLFTGLMAHADFARTNWGSVHTCFSGSAPLAEETLRRWHDAVGAAVYEGYGQTEAGPILTHNPKRGAVKVGSVGVPLPGTEIEIVDVERGDRVLSAGERGEIRARGPQIMAGYRNLPDETAGALRGGWLYTGDIGEFDADGYLYIRDRKKDMVIVGGYNVYPREVEEVLTTHPDVMEAAAVGAPDAYRGEVVKAFVVLRARAAAGPEQLIEHCRANLARYKVPAAIEVLEALPKTTVNKTDKQALRQRPKLPPGAR